jgi:hypothetical protein
MGEPYNYNIDVADPMKSFASGIETGLKQQGLQQQVEQQKLIQASYAKLRSPDATAQDYANLSMMLPETQAKAVRESFTMLSDERKNSALLQSGQVFSAFKSGKPDIAIGLIEKQAEARRNSGDEEGAKFLETWRDVAKENPKIAEDFFGFTIAQMPGGDKVITSGIELAKEGRAAEQAPSALSKSVADAEDAVNKATISFEEAKTAPAKKAAELRLAEATAKEKEIKAQFGVQQELAALEKSKWDVKNLKSQINDRAEKLNLDKQTTTAIVNEKIAQTKAAERNLPADVRKSINESAVNAAASKQSANQFNDLAKRITDQGGNYGVASSASDYLKKLGGFQGGMTQLKQEYTRLRNTAAIKALPPGPATDRDIALALKGFPSETASATDLSNFLRGMAKLQDIDASIANAKTDWLASNNGVLTRAKDTFIAGDYATKPNESFNDFTQRVVVDVTQRYNAPAQKPTPAGQQIPNEYAPAPPLNTVNRAVNDVRSAADRILEGR